MCDVYPYTAGSTQLIHVLPPEFQEGGTEALTKRLLDDAARKEMRARMEAGSDFENITLLVGFDNVVATASGRTNTAALRENPSPRSRRRFKKTRSIRSLTCWRRNSAIRG